MLRDTMLHEVLHTCTRMVGLDEELGDKTEEQVVARLTALLDVLRRNPKLVSFLVQGS